MRKKISVLFMIITLALILVACGDKFDLEAEQQAFDEMVLLVDIAVPTANRSSVVNSFAVPTELAGGATVTWTSSKPSYANFGVVGTQNLIVVTRPAEGLDNETIILTATITWTGESGTEYSDLVQFTIRVLAIPVAEVTTIADVRTGKLTVNSDVKFEDVIVISVVSNGITVFDPLTKHAIFVFGSAIANVSAIGDRGDIVGKYSVNFDSPQLITATLTKKSTMSFNDVLALATDFEVSDYWLEPGSNQQVVLDAKQSPELNTFVKFTGNVKDHPEWAGGSSTSYTTVFHDPLNEAKFVRSYYGSPRHDEIKLLNGIDNVTVYAVAYTVRDDRVKPATIEGVLASFEIFVIHYSAELTDAKAVELDKQSLSVAPTFVESGTLTLPVSGRNGTTIVWESSDQAVVNAATGAVTVTSGVQATVTLTATISRGSVTETRTFTVKVGQIPLSTVLEVRQAAANELVRFNGVLLMGDNNRTFVVHDATAAIMLFTTDTALIAQLNTNLGKQVTIEGTRSANAGMLQVTNFSVTVLGDAVDVPLKLNYSGLSLLAVDMLPYQGYLMSYQGLIVVSVTTSGSNNTTVVLKNLENQTISIYHASFAVVPEAEVAYLKALTPGTVVNIVDGVVGWFNNPQFYYTGQAQVVTVTNISDEHKVYFDAQALSVAAALTEDTTLTLPATGTNGSTISWSSSDEALINSTTGAVVMPASGQESVVLTAIVAIGEISRTLDFEVLLGTPEIPIKLLYSTGFESSEGFVASQTYNNVAEVLFGTQPNQWGMTYGTITTTGPIVDVQSAQMRWYTSAPTTYGQLVSKFTFKDVTTVEFSAAAYAGIGLTVSYSFNGTDWLGSQVIDVKTDKEDFVYNVNVVGEIYLKFQLTVPGTNPTATSRLNIDAIKVYGLE